MIESQQLLNFFIADNITEELGFPDFAKSSQLLNLFGG